MNTYIHKRQSIKAIPHIKVRLDDTRRIVLAFTWLYRTLVLTTSTQFKCGKFLDEYRGNGWFVSLGISDGFFLIGFRPTYWSVRIARLPQKHSVVRLYVGPFEFERTKITVTA